MNDLFQPKQNALPLQGPRTDETPNTSVPAPEKISKAEGDAAYLALAEELRDKLWDVTLGPAGILDLLGHVSSQSAVFVPLNRASQHLRHAARHMSLAVEQMGAEADEPIPLVPTDKDPE